VRDHNGQFTGMAIASSIFERHFANIRRLAEFAAWSGTQQPIATPLAPRLS
jgi:hypothetical protein